MLNYLLYGDASRPGRLNAPEKLRNGSTEQVVFSTRSVVLLVNSGALTVRLPVSLTISTGTDSRWDFKTNANGTQVESTHTFL